MKVMSLAKLQAAGRYGVSRESTLEIGGDTYPDRKVAPDVGDMMPTERRYRPLSQGRLKVGRSCRPDYSSIGLPVPCDPQYEVDSDDLLSDNDSADAVRLVGSVASSPPTVDREIDHVRRPHICRFSCS